MFLRSVAGSLVTRCLVIAGVLCLAWGFYLPAKARVGQVLLQFAWQQTLEHQTPDVGNGHRPWPWADTWPVARLRVPAYGIDQVVLAGAEGESLAWAPGQVAGSARLGSEVGNVALAGHRDTHFSFLRHLQQGDEVIVIDSAGVEHRYQVEATSIVDETDVGVLEPASRAVLTLVTCYPFDVITPGGPLRYVVRAVAMV